MLAELVTEVVCREIARQGTSRGRFISVSGFEADAIQREYLRLQNLHAASIHALFVAPQYRGVALPRISGRPRREATLRRSTIPA